MRHKIAASHFNRDSNQRQLLFKALLTGLLTHGTLTTTMTRAKELKRQADKVIGVALVDSVSTRRELHKVFGKRDIVNTLVERVAPALKGRTTGFTRIEIVGTRRGDNSEMVKVSLVTMPETIGHLKSGKVHPIIAKKAKAPVAAKVKKVKVTAEVKPNIATKVAKPVAKKATTKAKKA